jgi:hypothetical protein
VETPSSFSGKKHLGLSVDHQSTILDEALCTEADLLRLWRFYEVVSACKGEAGSPVLGLMQ